MIRSHLRHTHRQISEINITPFTDVCLVLLIIFLVTANTLTRESSVRLNLPKAVTNTTPSRFRSPSALPATDNSLSIMSR